jgi:uncharacterized protein YciI
MFGTVPSNVRSQNKNLLFAYPRLCKRDFQTDLLATDSRPWVPTEVWMLVARICLDIDQSTALRSNHRVEHNAHLRGGAVEIYAAGPLRVDGREEPVGSLYSLDVSTLQQAQKFHDDDPYTLAGVLATVTIARRDKRLGRA